MAPCVMVDAMAAELQVLEASNEESFLHCRIIRQVEELGQNRAEGYDALRQDQHTGLDKVRLGSLMINILGSSDSIV